MDYLQNHCWCSESNWDGQHYDCLNMVTLRSYGEGYKDDWENLIDEQAETIFDKAASELFSERVNSCTGGSVPKGELERIFTKHVKNLRPHVIKWLEDNVRDRSGEDCNKGWCIGSTNYRAKDSCSSMSVFFHRKSDAMKFIKTFSKWKKPIHYCQYFTDVRKTLNLSTGKYKRD